MLNMRLWIVSTILNKKHICKGTVIINIINVYYICKIASILYYYKYNFCFNFRFFLQEKKVSALF